MAPELFALSYLDSMIFAFSEITGRSCCRGVLTFEPTEISIIPLPILKDTKVDFKEIDSLIKNKKIHEVLDIIDDELL